MRLKLESAQALDADEARRLTRLQRIAYRLAFGNLDHAVQAFVRQA